MSRKVEQVRIPKKFELVALGEAMARARFALASVVNTLPGLPQPDPNAQKIVDLIVRDAKETLALFTYGDEQ